MQRDEVLAILRLHRADLERRGVKSLALFGSTARGEARPDSDVDLLVEFASPVGFFEFYDLQRYLESVLRTSVDLGTAVSMKPRVRERVLGEAIYVS